MTAWKTPASAALVFCLCFVPRALYLLWNPPAANPGIYYWELSDNLLRDGSLAAYGRLSSAFEPLYPLFLAGARWLTGDRLPLVLALQIGVASVGAVLFFHLCLRLSGDRRAAWIGTLLYALNPYAIHQSIQVIEITLLCTLLIAAILLFDRIRDIRSALAAGIALGVALLARAAVLPVALFAIVLLAWQRRVPHALCVTAAALLLVLPLALRNHALDGSSLFSRSGENLFVGNNPLARQVIPDYNTDLLGDYVEDMARRELPGYATASDQELDRYYSAKALQYVIEQPVDALLLNLENVISFFDPRIVPRRTLTKRTRLIVEPGDRIRVENAPERGVAVEAVQATYWGLVSLVALVGIWLRRADAGRDAMLYLTLLSFLMVCVVYFPATRLRAPVDFVPMFFAAIALARCHRRA